MTNPLYEMTNEELWQLFPVILVPHNENWISDYKTEANRIAEVIGDNVERISHIGSTAVPGLIAKPTIDVLLEINRGTDLASLMGNLKKIAYLFAEQPQKPPPHMMFMKGYTPGGFAKEVYHVHVRYFGDWDEFYFRDYLINHPEEAQEYGALKQQLHTLYEHDRDAYTDAKTDFIIERMRKAREESTVDYGKK